MPDGIAASDGARLVPFDKARLAKSGSYRAMRNSLGASRR
jgi:hypothetical protein